LNFANVFDRNEDISGDQPWRMELSVHYPLMMEAGIVSETLKTNSILTRLIA
jgi:hypothetical protein